MTKKTKEPIRLRETKLENGNISLYLDFYKDGKRSYEFLHLYLIPEKTIFDKERNKTTIIQAEAIKAKRVIEYQSGIYGVVTHSMFNGKTILNLAKEEYELRKSKGMNSCDHFRVLADKLEDYGDMQVSKINARYIKGFIKYMGTTKVSHAKNSKKTKIMSPSSQSLYLAKLNFLLNKAVKSGMLSTNPMERIDGSDKPKNVSKELCYLTLDEVKRMAMTKTAKTSHCREAFLFCCFTGLRYSDVSTLTWGNIIDLKVPTISKMQVKTKTPVMIPLSENAQKWLPKKSRNAKDSDLVFKNITNRDFINRYLDKWAKLARINKHITFHVSRHTAATLWLTYGADLYTVSKLLGHTNIETTQIYAKVVDSLKATAINNVPSLDEKASPLPSEEAIITKPIN